MTAFLSSKTREREEKYARVEQLKALVKVIREEEAERKAKKKQHKNKKASKKRKHKHQKHDQEPATMGEVDGATVDSKRTKQ